MNAASVSRVLSANLNISEETLEQLIAESDPSNAKSFYGSDKEIAKTAVLSISTIFVDQFLNNPDVAIVPIRRKTKFLLVLNNFALHKAVRNQVFNAIKNLSGIFEDAMKKEGTMPFDSELGRMSEHVLVLMMRVLNYKIKAAQVHEFAESNTQFAIQLLLAVLLKEPAYEFELRCNCISGLLGFTQPQAYFTADEKVEVNDCSGFTEKVDFSLNLMLKLSALQVVNDVICVPLLDSPTVSQLVQVTIINMMRCVMNIFYFSSQHSQQWRQHILLSTTFVDGVTILYLNSQVHALDTLLRVTLSQLSPNIPLELLSGITTALKFISFATFHMGRHARAIRPLCTFAHDLFQLPIQSVIGSSSILCTAFTNMYANFFHMLCNLDAFAGDDGLSEGECDMLIPELTSLQLCESMTIFLRMEVPGQLLTAWHSKYFSIDTDALVAQDSATFQAIDSIYCELKKSSSSPLVTQSGGSKSLLGDLPPPTAPPKAQRVIEKISNSAAPVAIQQNFVQPTKRVVNESAQGGGKYSCSLNGHTMKTPVVSPYGHNFEKETIEQWIKQQGSFCPVTGNPLKMEDLKPNKTLQNEIMQAVIQQSMTAFNQEDASDLYDF